jgi:hypothetical protein
MERLPWFPCYSNELLSTLGGMGSVEQHVYLIILLRIYDSGGVCRDTVGALAMRTGNKRHIVGRALASLVKSGRIVLDSSGGMTNPKATLVLADMAAFHERQKQAGKIGAAARWNPRTQSLHNSNTIPPLEKPQQNQQNDDAIAMRSDAHLHLHRQSKKEVSNPPVVPPRGRAHRLPDDFKLSPEMETYAGEHSLNASDLFAPFCDHHRAKGNAMVDWTAAWRTWVRNEVKFSKNRMNGNGHAPRPGSKEDSRERTQAALAAFAPNDGTYDCRTGPRPREPLFEIFPNPQLGKP